MTTRLDQAPRLDQAESSPYHCALCGAAKVVPSLARDCERKHLEA